MSAYINRYFLLMAVFLPLWCVIRRPWKHWSLHEGCLMAFAALLFSLLCLVLRGTWAAPGDMLAADGRGHSAAAVPHHYAAAAVRPA